MLETSSLLVVLLMQTAQLPPPPPPGPPRFMTMKGLPLSCFRKPNFEEEGLEFFVCNGGGGIAGVRKKDDPAHTIFVRDPDIAQNLNMQVALAGCVGKRFAVNSDATGTFFFSCEGKEIGRDERFRTASKADWRRYDKYLTR
jgi:hypothetical protein